MTLKSTLSLAVLGLLVSSTTADAGLGWLFHCGHKCHHKKKCCCGAEDEKPRCCFDPPAPPDGEIVDSAPVRITSTRAERSEPADQPADAADAANGGCGPQNVPPAPGLDTNSDEPLTSIDRDEELQQIRMLELELKLLKLKKASAQRAPLPPDEVRRR